ncbi:tudor domain-containing protein 5-like isoform X1 [Rhincodon typus]|uniref:tudor domain-containing protein 5-like isoform X1 n=1 Tax=Rhincodon typus TaxID=259920 RepID=UPI00202E1AB9|nr:tudor domain-containing protein 5-like isoform X1 [Rhincodon typus]XP_048465552.1 tudor domain-containing protein 5-like isoform X1 [Rhincodon typus]XP_048465553.1 tudor domain-containing protein 5-like isoform X1 [Rhincodon typus]
MSDQEKLLEILKKELRSLLISAKSSLTPVELERDYHSMMGKQLPLCALGYRSVLELASSIPDTIKIHARGDGSILLKGIGNETTKGIEELVAKAKVSAKTKRNVRKTRAELMQKQAFLPRRYNTTPILPALVKCELRELVASFPGGVLLSDFDKSFMKRYGRPFQYTRYGFYSLQEVLKAAGDDIEIQQTRRGSLLLPRNKNRESPLKQGKWSNQSVQSNPAQTHAKMAVPSPTKPPTDNQIVSALKTEDLPDPAPVPEYFDGGLKKLVEDLRTVLVDKGVEGTIDLQMKEKIRFTVAQRPDGLLASKLPTEFKNIFGMELPLKELGFYSVTELVGALSDTLYVERDSVNQDWLVFDIRHHKLLQKQAELQLNKINSLLSADQEGAVIADSREPERNLNLKTINVETVAKVSYPPEIEIPPDAIQDGNLYKLPELEENSFVCVFVESVTSPSQFYIRFYGDFTSMMLEDLMIEMRRCYSYEEVSERYVMPDSFIQPGQVCCVRNPDDVWWYRVIIHRVLDEKLVEVYYVDFGDVSPVERSRLRFLKCCHSKLPAQGIPSTLMWLQPSEDDWSIAAKNQFLRFCGKQPLVALICGYVEDVLHLFLCDTSTDEDIYINDVLKKAGHAVPCLSNDASKAFEEFNPAALYLKSKPVSVKEISSKVKACPTAPLDRKLNSSTAEESDKKSDLPICGDNNEEDFESITYDLPYLEPYPFCTVTPVQDNCKSLKMSVLEVSEEVEYNELPALEVVEEEKLQELCCESLNSMDHLQNPETKLKTQDEFYISIIDTKHSAESGNTEIPSVYDKPGEKFKPENIQPFVKTDTKKVWSCTSEILQKESIQDSAMPLLSSVQEEPTPVSPELSAPAGQSKFHVLLSSPSAALGPSARMAGALHHLSWLSIMNKNL